MLGPDRFAFETPNVIDMGDLPPSRPRRQSSIEQQRERRDSNTDSTDENSTSSEELLHEPARDSATRLLRDMGDLDHLAQDYDPYDEEEAAVTHEQLPSVEEARMYATSLLSAESKRRPYQQETTPLSLSRTIKLDSPNSKHLVRKRLVRCLVPFMVVIGLLGTTIALGIALVNRLSEQSTGSSSVQRVPETRHEQIADFLAKEVSSRQDLETLGTPQELALNWVSDIDPLQYEVPTGRMEDEFQLVQRYVLATFFFALRGTGWNASLNFMTEQNECGWFEASELGFVELETAVGVSCDANLRVTGLFVPSNKLQGRIPAELRHLSHLALLAMPYNELKGGLPDALSDLSNLIYLDVRSNKLEGSIPEWVGDFEYLEVLGLSNNQFIGSVPPSMGTLGRLKTLALDDNILTGSMSFAGHLTNLEYFYADGNVFNTTIGPDFLENLSRLRELDLSWNLLDSEEFPAKLLSLPALQVLDLAYNFLGGSIPFSIPSNNVLEFLSLRDNELNGTVPINLPSLSRLSHLDLHGNMLEGSLPLRMKSMDALTFLFLGDNDFYPGRLPDVLSELTNLKELSLSNTQLGSFLPNWLKLLSNLKLLDLSHNKLTGIIPVDVWNLPDLSYLLLHDNLLVGTLPATVEGADKLKVISVHRNGIFGSADAFCDAVTNLDLFATDCSSGLLCTQTCCPTCCKDDGFECYEEDVLHSLTSVAGEWELEYKDTLYSFDPAIIDSGVARAVP
jgi:Leucine-rich repeat (LRR) protein